jgi:hypothetical protein
MSNFDFAALAAFLERTAVNQRGIINYSRGQWTIDDLHGEACMAAIEMGDKRGYALDLDDPADAEQLLRRLWNRARSAGGVLRNAERPDQASSDDEGRGPRSWERVSPKEAEHPLSLLEELKCGKPAPAAIDPYHSEAAAWNWLVHRFNRSTRDIAAFLLISSSWCRKRRRRARHHLGTQWQLPHCLSVEDDELAIQPWRKFKLPTQVVDPTTQLAMNFWSIPAQPAFGQLWLL